MNAITAGRRHVADANLEAHARTAAAVGDLAAMVDELAPRVLEVRTFVLDGNGQARSEERVPYRALAVSHIAKVAATTTNVTGSVTSPGAGATIAQIPLPAGVYSVSWSVERSGTLAVADLNNFLLFQSGTGSAGTLLTSDNLAVAGEYPQLGVTLQSAAADNFIKVLTNGAATAGAVYTAQMTVTQLPTPGPLYVANMPPQQSMPVQGPGIVAMRSGGMIAVNLRGRSFTVYGGSAGDIVTVTAFGSHVPPVSS
jgi:hypothetical protein